MSDLNNDILIHIFNYLSPFPNQLLNLKTPTKKSIFVKSNTALSILNCSLVSKSWFHPGITLLWQNIILSNNNQALKIMKNLPTYQNFVKVLDTYPSVCNSSPISQEILSTLIMRLPKLQKIRVCCLPLSPEWFLLLNRACPLLKVLDARNCENVMFYKVDLSRKKVIGSQIIKKIRQVLVHSNTGLKFVNPTVNASVSSYLGEKRELCWNTEMRAIGIGKEDHQIKTILNRLKNLEEVRVSLELNCNENSRRKTKLYFPELLIPLILTQSLKILDLRHNMEYLSDVFLSSLSTSENLEVLKLSIFSNFTDLGLIALSKTKCSKKIKTFEFENNINIFGKDSKHPTFSEHSLGTLIQSFKRIQSLKIQLIKGYHLHDAITSNIFHCQSFNESLTSGRLRVVSLSGGQMVDYSFVMLLGQSSCLNVIELEGVSPLFDSRFLSLVLPICGRNLTQLKFVVEESKIPFVGIQNMIVKFDGTSNFRRAYSADDLSIILIKFAKMLKVLIIKENVYISPTGLAMLIKGCPHLTILSIENSYQYKSSSIIDALQELKKGEGSCLQFLSFAVELDVIGQEKMFKFTKRKFPTATINY